MTSATLDQNSASEVDLSWLTDFAAAGLAQMLDPSSGLFCHRVLLRNGRLAQDGLSHRYTAMTLLGLHRYEATGRVASIRTAAVTESFLHDCKWVKSLGDAGLLLWLSALAYPGVLTRILRDLSIFDCLTAWEDGREGRTMELAWLLAGVAHAAEAEPTRRGDLEKLALEIYRRLDDNQAPGGCFAHQTHGRIGARLRKRIGSFADQVYPIYALSTMAQVFDFEPALQAARRCADVICRLQGPLGQWWWHYDSITGIVIQRYPVYSVHQDAMAPMALLAVKDSIHLGYARRVYRGLQWIYGRNELGIDLIDRSHNVIWRSIYGSQITYVNDFVATNLLKRTAPPRRLDVLFECRPYHLGWLLYGLVGQMPDADAVQAGRQTALTQPLLYNT